MLDTILILLGLTVFEIVCSIDNAVINAGVLRTMSKQGRRWFLLWGMLIAVVFVRGVVPWAIIWAINPSLGFIGSLQLTFQMNPESNSAFADAAPLLLTGAAMFLAALFLHWLFLEEKRASFPHERFLYRNGTWFWVSLLILLTSAWWYGAATDIRIGQYASYGLLLFGITYYLKRSGEWKEERILKRHSKKSERKKILYLEVIDSVFSIDAILGALAFTFSVPLILIGNGIGAVVMRQLTVQNIKLVQRYRYLKHGAMYAIGVLSFTMLLEVAGVHLPNWLSPVIALGFVVWAFLHK